MSDFEFDPGTYAPTEHLVRQAKDLIAIQDYNSAKPIVAQILKLDPENSKALWMYANLIKDDNPAKAIHALKRLLKVDPENPKARQLLNILDDDDPFPVQHPLTAKPNAYQQPVINVNVSNTAGAQAVMNQPVLMLQGKRVNQTAFIIGSIAAFFGLFGIAHIFNGKVGKGILWIILGFIWDTIAVVLITTAVLACVAVAVHIYLMYSVSKEGAEYDTISTVTSAVYTKMHP